MTGFESIVGVDPWTALFTFLNMLITFAILGKFLFKPVKKMIDERQKEIDDTYAGADAAKKAAEELKAEYETKLEDAKSERDEIVHQAVIHAQKREEEILAEARENANAIREKAHADIEQEKKKALNEVKNEISSISIGIAEKVCEKEIDEAKHKELVLDFISKIGEAS